jgi:hypothetical protein
MSALGQKQTCAMHRPMSALGHKGTPAPFYSIISSAGPSRESGVLRPRAFAGLRLIIIFKLRGVDPAPRGLLVRDDGQEPQA